jgi:hypothetical protein
MVGNEALRRLYELERAGLIREWRKLHSKDTHNLYSCIIVKVSLSSVVRKFISRVSVHRHAIWMGGKGDEKDIQNFSWKIVYKHKSGD